MKFIGQSADPAKCMEILQSIVEHKRKARRWEQEFYPITFRSCIRPGAPEFDSPEVQLLISIGAVRYTSSSSNDAIPDDSLRITEKGEEAIGIYVATMRPEEALKIKDQNGEPTE